MSETPKIPDGILASQVKALEAELKEAVALLEAEREANAEAVARFQAEKEEAAAQLDAERKARDAERKAKVEAVRKLATVVAEINSDATLQARRRRADATATSVEAPDPDDPMVRKVGPNMLSKNMTINCRSDVTIHEDPIIFLDALLGDQTKVGKMLYQKRVEEYVFYWSFMASNTKSCDLLLRMWVERQDEDGVVVRVESVEEVELQATSIPNPYSKTSKKLRLLLKEGTIVLRPLQFGQTSFTFMGQVDVGEITKDVTKDTVVASMGTNGTLRRSTTSITTPTTTAGNAGKAMGFVKLIRAGAETANASELFCNLAEMFYERFKKEDTIDARRKADFIENGIPNAPPLTGNEQDMIAKLMRGVEVKLMQAKRIAGTANDSVEKFLNQDGEGGAAWGMSVAKMDVAATTLFTE
ncbi:hypothetical protein TrVE_jg640, partial [Triparma verrucosa]